ncbi:glycolipid transfer protein [Wallemia mellicola]|uniref:Glycolipid transfer protein n=2 Tax=Wallemia mellicola TaxID=1708541 RepID=A0A4T0PXT5_9BASI|nr:glycolipid transfer protein [Wallemia mellicola CBS 633.66]TIB70893.1 hypothetical protein E3Q24_02653 [Wallemia mellicola]EIM22187.1 glycolipid transfer protein [Wallemia mellicola CBS 633.66]TIB74314.1 hypothetical protein E3Q23_02735 [Wallemia mellicola]TIB77653.1 glycolipid transfer protein [Wallemia mellicola]TIB83438.1 glycolipid transfer protein [Wallemia mellicola]|eukprot:XP_006957982.1 glycolipid transfer protein [Wallemia mellicola CBS 633.66]
MSYFDKVKEQKGQLFNNVTITEKGVNTTEFLDAAAVVVQLFDILGNKAFSVVQNDLLGNIKKVRDRHDAEPLRSGTLEELVAAENLDKKTTATQGLVWLLRGLEFTYKALLRSLRNPTEELSESFSKAYEDSLKKFHSFVVKPIFNLAMKACPYRKDFYEKLGGDPTTVEIELGDWLSALEKQVLQVQDFMKQHNYDKGL